jgi:hypothetical protein
MKQMSLATVGFERYGKTTRRAVFLAEMGRVVPWAMLCGLIEPVYPNLRKSIKSLRPAEYICVDISAGRGVDQICRAEDLVAEFGPQSFDVVISTGML